MKLTIENDRQAHSQLEEHRADDWTVSWQLDERNRTLEACIVSYITNITSSIYPDRFCGVHFIFRVFFWLNRVDMMCHDLCE